jgi:hypothetical protein
MRAKCSPERHWIVGANQAAHKLAEDHFFRKFGFLGLLGLERGVSGASKDPRVNGSITPLGTINSRSIPDGEGFMLETFSPVVRPGSTVRADLIASPQLRQSKAMANPNDPRTAILWRS